MEHSLSSYNPFAPRITGFFCSDEGPTLEATVVNLFTEAKLPQNNSADMV